MTKSFCDICTKEIPLNAKLSVYQYVEIVLTEQGTAYAKKSDEYCEACTLKIKETRDKLKKDSKDSKSSGVVR